MNENYEKEKLNILCDSVKKLCSSLEYKKCEEIIYDAIREFPHSAIPHNLIGIVLSREGDTKLSMKHFRVSWTLDPTYRPASYNLHNIASFDNNKELAFDEDDIKDEEKSNMKVIYDEYGVGHVVSKYKVIYDKPGVGHFIKEER